MHNPDTIDASGPLVPNAAPSPPLSPEDPSPFIEGTRIQWAWDSSSLSAMKRCPREYFYSQYLGLRRKRRSAPATFGGAFAKAMEVFETEAPRLGREPATTLALEAAAIAAEGMEDHKSRTKEALMRSIAAYINHHATDSLETMTMTNGEPAVEMHFQIPLGNLVPAIPGTTIVLCGYMDRVVRFQDSPYVLDNKTTGSSISTEKGSEAYFKNFTPDNQMTTYTWAAREGFGFPVRGVIVDAMQIAKTKTEFARSIIHRTPAQIDEWRSGLPYWVRLAAASSISAMGAKTPTEAAASFPMNETSCHKYGGCPYRNICGKDPAVRQAFLDTDFEVREWNPLAKRTKGTIANQDATAESEPTDD